MHPVVTHIGSGLSYFTGLVALTLILPVFVLVRNRGLAVLLDVLALLGVTLVALSSTPIPPALYWTWLVAVIVAVATAHFRDLEVRRRIAVLLPAAAMCVVLIAVEVPHHVRPNVPDERYRRMYILGDSITAGIGREGGPLWPALVRADRAVEIVDLAQSGATIGTMIDALDRRGPLRDGLVLLEIGGNDIFGRASPETFERDLETLVARAKGPGRAIVMMELPLFPFHAEYGQAQRRVARRHQVLLIPKRYFAHVLTWPDATLDGLHLSDTGHRRMATVVGDLLGPAMLPSRP